MKRLEIIRVRHTGSVPEGLLQDIQSSAETLTQLTECRLYRHAEWASDLSVHLYFEASADDPRARAFGIRVADALSEHGMVEHTVWLEATNETNEEPKP